MSGTKKSHAALLDELAVLDPPQRREVAAELRRELTGLPRLTRCLSNH
jgi:hypothetical protein